MSKKYKSLMVIVNNYISDFILKGEIIDRYYNPGDLFDEVHIMLLNNDCFDVSIAQKLVGSAKLYIHNYPKSKRLFFKSIGMRTWLLKNWSHKAVEIATEIKPLMVRCYNSGLNAYLAYRIKQELGIPYAVSLHTSPDNKKFGRDKSFINLMMEYAYSSVAKISLKNADIVLPVYNSIVPYLKRMGVKNYEVAYNVINPSNIIKKIDYRLHDPVKIICVGRQIPGKCPDNIIRAIHQLDNIHLTIIGDGSYHDCLEKLVSEYQIGDRVSMLKSVTNDELCRMLPEFDIFAVHSDYMEIPKTVLEALLTGLPVVVNKAEVSEYKDDFLVQVDNNCESYRAALFKLINNNDMRTDLGHKAYRHAHDNWDPQITEQRFIEIYRKIIESNSL